jgi:biopolymer transport protein TolQ
VSPSLFLFNAAAPVTDEGMAAVADAVKEAATGKAGPMDPWSLFLQADIVVQIVMIGLLIASIATWAIMIAHAMKMREVKQSSEKFEREFWRSNDIDAFNGQYGKTDTPSARIFSAGLAEWRRSTAKPNVDRDGTRERLGIALQAAVGAEVDKLSDRLNILATVGSVAPFVGLFGTVWGIMRSFTAIAAEQNTSLAIVAPGIAEALFATAIGLFAAIPAVIAYNRLGHGVNRMESRLSRFADGFHATLSRELEASPK